MFTLSINQERINLKPEERISKDLFSAIRGEGWLWSRTANAFVFKFNEEGAKRVQRLEEHHISKYYPEEQKKSLQEEFNNIVIKYDSEETKESISKLIASVKEKADALKAEREAKESHARDERVKRYNKCIEQLNTLENGFGVGKYDLSLSNFNMSDLLARGGVRIDHYVKDLAEQFGYEDKENLISDKDILELSIRYGNNWKNWKIESRHLIFECSHMMASDNSFITGGSGHFHIEQVILEREPRINFKNVVKLSALIDETILKICFETYISYLKGEVEVLREVNSLGMLSEDIVGTSKLSILKDQFIRSM